MERRTPGSPGACLWTVLTLVSATTLWQPPEVTAQEDAIASAMSAAPASVAENARIIDWEMNLLRAGSNGWTCLPDRPDSPGGDPMCVNGPWLDFIHALVNKTEPTYSQVGVAYMLAGDTPVSNTDPYATEPTSDEDWVDGLGAHLMVLVPDRASYENISTDPKNGGPWIMWPDTPYAHLMIPVESYPSSSAETPE